MFVGVIGGSGFIGSHVVDKLVEEGHDVTVFDIMRPYRDDLRHIYIDITDFSRTTVALAGGYDVVYILAAMADVNDVYKNPAQAGEVNIMGVANVLEAAKRSGVGRVILASTVWIYEMAQEKINEEASLAPFEVKHVYTASKVAAELYCHAYKELYQQDFTILRYGIPYGSRARGGTVIALFVRKALNGEPITIMGDGSQYRSFIYVEDLAAGNTAALQEVAINQTYNLEGSRPVTIKEIAEIIQKLVGHTKIEYKESRPGDYSGSIVSAAKAKSELGWEPKISFEEGMRRYIEWYKSSVGKG